MRLLANSRLKRSNLDSTTGVCFPFGSSIPFVFISAIISFLTYPLKFRFLTNSNIARSIALFVLNATGFGNLWRSFKSNHLRINMVLPILPFYARKMSDIRPTSSGKAISGVYAISLCGGYDMCACPDKKK